MGPFASSAARSGTDAVFAHALLQSKTTPLLRNGTKMALSSESPARLSACPTTSMAGVANELTPPVREATLAPSVVRQTIMPPPANASEKYKIIKPYYADAFEFALTKFSLLNRYPDLPLKLRYGFPLGDLAPITTSFTPPNSPSVSLHSQLVSDYLSNEVRLGHMSGPYSRVEVENILRSPFRSSPLTIVEKPGGFRIVHNSSAKDRYGVSTNDQINSDDFPMKWGSASTFAQIVSLSLSVPSLAPVPLESFSPSLAFITLSFGADLPYPIPSYRSPVLLQSNRSPVLLLPSGSPTSPQDGSLPFPISVLEVPSLPFSALSCLGSCAFLSHCSLHTGRWLQRLQAPRLLC
jgi:hypothetical protein